MRTQHVVAAAVVTASATKGDCDPADDEDDDDEADEVDMFLRIVPVVKPLRTAFAPENRAPLVDDDATSVANLPATVVVFVVVVVLFGAERASEGPVQDPVDSFVNEDDAVKAEEGRRGGGGEDEEALLDCVDAVDDESDMRMSILGKKRTFRRGLPVRTPSVQPLPLSLTHTPRSFLPLPSVEDGTARVNVSSVAHASNGKRGGGLYETRSSRAASTPRISLHKVLWDGRVPWMRILIR